MTSGMKTRKVKLLKKGKLVGFTSSSTFIEI